jgi:hypothetical protein
MWEEIKRIMAQIKSRPAIDALVDGFLLVTPKQFDALRKLADDKPLGPTFPPRSPLGDIPVLVVGSNKPVNLPSGRVAVNALDTIYILPGEPWKTMTPS